MNDPLTPLPRDVLDRIASEVAAERLTAPARPAVDQAALRYEPPRLKVHVVCYEDYDAWILGKFARRLTDAVAAWGHEVTLGKAQDPSADLNHHIIYYDYLERKATPETVLITHIDNERELAKVRRQLLEIGVEMGVCLSYEAVRRLEHFGIPRDRLCFITPAHDAWMKPRRTLVGLTTRLYPDGCKREHLLTDVCDRISPAEFRFAIMGSGWDAIVNRLRRQGFEVLYIDHFHQSAYCTLMQSLDYYLYLGRDEGSMGFLDALAAGVPTIVTAQGFHLDVPGGITHSFRDAADLCDVFERIGRERRARATAVASLTWTEHARQHLLLWDYLLKQARGQEVPAELRRALAGIGVQLQEPVA